MYLKKCKKDNFSIEISGYLANLQVPGYVNKSKLGFVSGDYDCLTVAEVIKAAGYDPSAIINRRLLITIEDEI